jgi:ABC-type phosphate/phosphonate transport system ATPase subunit
METPQASTQNQFIINEETQKLVQKMGEARLLTLFEVLNKYLKSIDKVATTIIVAIAVAHCIPGEMLWVRLYGGSRSGKTELLRAIARHPDSTEMEVITPASIRGGLEEGHRLLERINGKLVITKDLVSSP